MPELPVVAIVGSGIIGASWAIVFARAGCRVRVLDASSTGRVPVLTRLAAALHAIEGTSLRGSPDLLSLVSVHADIETTVAGASWIQESVAETIDVKTAVIRAIEEAAAPDAVIATSTSGLLPSALAECLRHKGRFLVVHPLTPPHIMPLTEIVAAPSTDPEVVARATELMRAVGQKPILVKSEIAGFVANRVMAAMMNEIFSLVRDGVVEPEDADAVLTDGFALRWAIMGPLAGMDLNASGGISDYLSRFAYLFDGLAASRGVGPVLDGPTIARIDAALRARVSLADLPARALRRDQAIAALRGHRMGETPL